MPTYWEVVGGGEAGGIVVREGKELQSKALEWRLTRGSVVMQVEAAEDRVHYYMVMGQGPPEGWVSIKTKSVALLKERDIAAERWFKAIKEMRSQKKDPSAVKTLAQELVGLIQTDEILKGGLVTNGLIEVCAGVMKAFPADLELQGALVCLLGQICLFNEYACRKAGKSGAVEATLAYFKGNPADRNVQVQLGQLGCFLDYDAENRQMMADSGGFAHCFEMCRLHRADAEVCFNALCAASNPLDFYPQCAAAGAAEVLTGVLWDFRGSDKVKSEAGMVAKGLLRSEHAYECSVSFGQAGMGEAFVTGVREHLGSRPMQANGCHVIGFIAQVPEYRTALAKAGAIDVILAAIQENIRCPGFCWGLQGMEDSLWRVLDNCSEALLHLQTDSLENRMTMIRAGAIDILKSALQHEGPNPFAQSILDALEGHCLADPSTSPQPRTSFEGQWIQNLRPQSSGIFKISAQEGSISISVDQPQEIQWDAISWAVNGDEVAATSPEGAVGLTGKLVNGKICWSWQGGEILFFYPFQTLDE